MTVLEFAYVLGLSDETIRRLSDCSIANEDFQSIQTSLYENENEAWSVFEQLNPVQCLYVCLQLALQMQYAYAQIGIPQEVFWDSVKDIAIWNRDHENKTGMPGLTEWKWVARTLQRKLFRVGRLQYESKILEEKIFANQVAYKKGSLYLMVHIPAEEALNFEDALSSMNSAVPFFQTYFSLKHDLFLCRSWLLAPELKELLPENSRILQFQSLFHIIEVKNDPYRQAEARVFGFISDDPRLYPETTSLQRSLKSFLLLGSKTTCATGIRSTNKLTKTTEM